MHTARSRAEAVALTFHHELYDFADTVEAMFAKAGSAITVADVYRACLRGS